ncbi:MAG: ATP-binding protein [Saprospiraceae bacterium]
MRLSILKKSLIPAPASKPERQLNLKAYAGLMGALAGLKQYSYALDYLAPAQTEAQLANDSNLLAPVFKMLGAIYMEMGKPDSALHYFERAYWLFGNQGNLRFQAEVLGLSIDCLHKLDQSRLAKIHLQALSNLSEKINTPALKVAYFARAAALGQRTGFSAEALRYANIALVWADSTRSNYYKTIILKTRAEALESLGQSSKAISDLNKVLSIKDSIANQDKVGRSRRILLRQQSAQQDAERKAQLDEARYQQNRIVFAWALSGVLALAALAFLLFCLRTYKKIERQNDELEQLHKLKDRLFGIISHDLRSPLHKALILLNDRPPCAENLALLRDTVARTTLMTDSLLAWASVQMKNMANGQRVEVLPAQFVENVLEANQNEIIDKKLHVSNAVDARQAIMGCPDLLQITLRNIVSNAIRHSPVGKQIMVKSEIVGGEYRLSVRDEGPGFAVEDGLLLFKPGPLAHSTFSAQAGIGLYLCQELLRKEGARIEVASEPSMGSTFTICCSAKST